MKGQLIIRRITGQLEVLTGLRIGGANEQMEISGIDMPIIRNPLTREPYIPGSSLKGKMRSLLEWSEGRITNDGSVFQDPEHPICRLFGISPNPSVTASEYSGPTRLVVRDALMCEEDRQRFRNGAKLVELKTENMINRLKGAAEHPRTLERVIPGVRFEVELLFRMFDAADEELYPLILKGLALVQADCLGGCGSRGCGKVKFHLKDESGKDITLPELDATQAKAG